ncbi:hypothetical protein [Agrobacterium pusense]|uniref:hypothetical protein n=1 Tax=Agrobacterium pusense TaxID=648995 RepID=UPI0010AEA6DA|nr:hypothetical protein [Agrobacterium pusense]WCK26617.1 hypothetical protein CFBP5496_0020670 [Agrobacterium pusense]
MYGKSLSENGKSVSEVEMNSIALNEAKDWADALMDMEFRGRGDREKSVRGRVSKRTGIPESYLYRLQYKTREMKDVAGSAYRALKLTYDELCRLNEEAADRHHAERMRIRGNHETADEKPAQAGLGMDSSED